MRAQVMVFITYPLIIVINTIIAIFILPWCHIAVQCIFFVLLAVVVVSLALTVSSVAKHATGRPG